MELEEGLWGALKVVVEMPGGDIKSLQGHCKVQMSPRDTGTRDGAPQTPWSLTKAKRVSWFVELVNWFLDIYQPSSPPSGCYQMWPSPRNKQMGPESYPGARLLAHALQHH